MLVQENIQPLARFFQTVTTDTNTAFVAIANAHAVRIVAHTGTVAGTNVLRVFVNDAASTSGAVELTAKATPNLQSDRSYEIFVTGEEAISGKPGATHLYAQVDVGGASPSVPIAIEIAAFPARSVPDALPTNWTRII